MGSWAGLAGVGVVVVPAARRCVRDRVDGPVIGLTAEIAEKDMALEKVHLPQRSVRSLRWRDSQAALVVLVPNPFPLFERKRK